MPTSPGPLLEAVEALWSRLRSRVPTLPDARYAVVTTPAVTAHPPSRLSWEREGVVTGLTLSSETVSAGAEAVVEAVLHDAAHVLAWTRAADDTANKGTYHTGVFRTVAIEAGLAWPDDARRHTTAGFAGMRLSDETRAALASDLAHLADVIPAVSPALAVAEADRPVSRDRIALRCSCVPARSFRIAQTVADLGPITCGVCGKPFKAA